MLFLSISLVTFLFPLDYIEGQSKHFILKLKVSAFILVLCSIFAQFYDEFTVTKWQNITFLSLTLISDFLANLVENLKEFFTIDQLSFIIMK
jgi:hypothetical protein